MGTKLVLASAAILTQEKLQDEAASAQRFADHSRSDNTTRAYEADWRSFTSYCHHRGFGTLPAKPQTVALYISWLAEQGKKAATISRHLAAISKRHSLANYTDSPTAMRHACVKDVWAGIRRVNGTAQTAKEAATLEYLKSMLQQTPDSLVGKRDRAILLLGFAGALRRSELASLDRSDVSFGASGITITIRRSKTDQEGAGQKVGVPRGKNPDTCPVRALQAWLVESKITSGPLFRRVDRNGKVIGSDALSDQVVALVIKKHAEAAQLDPSLFSGHSLRAGLATSAAQNGVSERSIQNQTRHRSLTMVRRYIRDGNLFRENAAAGAGL